MGGKGEIVLQHERTGYILHMYVWDTSFAPHEKKEVKVEYYGGWGNALTPSVNYFIYVTETGALWSGTIGKADIYLKLSNDFMKMLKYSRMKLRAALSGYIFKSDQLEWHFKNWKPTENIGVVIIDESSGNQSSLVTTNTFSEGIIVSKMDAEPPMPDAMYRCAGYFKTKQRYVASQNIIIPKNLIAGMKTDLAMKIPCRNFVLKPLETKFMLAMVEFLLRLT
jgi:hypothetical protein